MKVNKKLRAGVMSGLFTAGMVAPIASSVMPSFAAGGDMPLQGVDLETFKDTVEGKNYVPSIILNRGEVKRETTPRWELINDSGDLSGVEVYDNLPQKINNNYPEEITRARQSKIIGDFITEGPFSPEEYAKRYPGNNGNYGGDAFPDSVDSFKKTVYGKFRAGHRGMNFLIEPSWYYDNPNFKIKITYPKAAKKLVAVKDPQTGRYYKDYEDVDMVYTLSEFVMNAVNRYGNIVNPKEFPSMGISASYNPISGFKPACLESYTLDVKFIDANGRPVDVDVKDINEPNKTVAKGKVFFTFGSLNFYRKTAESVGMIEPPAGTKAFVSKDSNVGISSLKSQTQDPKYGQDALGTTINGSPWNSKYTGHTIFSSFDNTFIDNLLSSDYYRNAVTFACPNSESYKFRILTNCLVPPTEQYKDVWHNKTRTVQSGDGQVGWQFILTSPMFKTNEFPEIPGKDPDGVPGGNIIGSPKKTVSDADEHQKVENWVNDTNEIVTYNVSYKVGHLLGNMSDYYSNFIIQDSLPQGTSFVDARVVSEGKVISNSCTYDPSTHKVTWKATRDQLGYREMRMIPQKDGTRKQVEVPVPGTLKMLGETYTLQIRVRVNDVSKKALHENTASVTIDDQSISSNTVKTHTGKPSTVELEKTVKTPQGDNKLETDPKNTSDSARATILGEDNIYSLYATIPEDIKTYSEFTIEDKLDKQLTLKNGSIKAFNNIPIF